MTYLSLFSGIGGLDLGLDRAGFTCIGQCEIEPFALAVLEKHWPGIPKYTDVRSINGNGIGPVDAVVGGFPCQDLSVAGKGAGLAGAKSGLWFEMLRIITELRPRWVIAENVPALRTRGADTVLAGLEELGYTTWPVVVGVDDVGGPHRRKRVFLVGYAAGESRERGTGGLSAPEAGERGDGTQHGDLPERPEHAGEGTGEGDVVGYAESEYGRSGKHDGAKEERALQSGGAGVVAHSDSDPLWQQRECTRGDRTTEAELAGAGCDFAPLGGCGRCAECVADAEGRGLRTDGRASGSAGHADIGGSGVADAERDGLEGHGADPGGTQVAELGDRRTRWPAGPGQPQHDWEEPRTVELPVGESANGISSRLLRAANKHALKAFGNSVSPIVSEVIGRAVMAVKEQLNEGASK